MIHKKILTTILFVLLFSNFVKSQNRNANTTGIGIQKNIKQKKPRLLKLISTDFHAGCFISNYSTDLSDENINFNIDGYDEAFSEIKEKKQYPKGYSNGYTNGKYKIFYTEFEGKKEGESCLIEMKYKILIIYKKVWYKYMLDGFCGC